MQQSRIKAERAVPYQILESKIIKGEADEIALKTRLINGTLVTFFLRVSQAGVTYRTEFSDEEGLTYFDLAAIFSFNEDLDKTIKELNNN